MISGDTDPGRVFYRVKKCGCKDKDLDCQNLGNCQERPPDFRCQCKFGYTGPQCQILGEYDLKFCGWRLMKTPKETFCYGRASRGRVSELVGIRERVGKLLPYCRVWKPWSKHLVRGRFHDSRTIKEVVDCSLDLVRKSAWTYTLGRCLSAFYDLVYRKSNCRSLVLSFYFFCKVYLREGGGGLRGKWMGQGMVGKSISSVLKNTDFDLKLERAFWIFVIKSLGIRASLEQRMKAQFNDLSSIVNLLSIYFFCFWSVMWPAKLSIVGDHFLYSHDAHVWSSGNIDGRN